MLIQIHLNIDRFYHVIILTGGAVPKNLVINPSYVEPGAYPEVRI